MNRILICARGYPPDVAGGGEISTELIARGLKNLGADVHVLTFTDQEQSSDCVQDVPVHRLTCPNIYWSIHASKQPAWKKVLWHGSQALRSSPPLSIRDAIAKIQPTVLHTSTIEDFGPGLWRWAKKQGLITVHSLRSYNLLHRQATLYDARNDREIKPDCLSFPKRYFAKSVDGAIGISRCILEKHLEHGFFPSSKQVVIGNPIADPITAPITAPIQTTQPSQPSAELPIRLGILGRISEEKGIKPFLQCLKQLESVPTWNLKIAGKGHEDYVRTLQNAAGDLPVHWVGWQSSHEFLSQLDLLVVPSRWHEPFGRIVVEAYSVGLPVLCLHRGAMPELVTEGETGWIVDQWDPDSVGAAIVNCRTVDREAIRSSAQQYTIDQIARRHQAFYQELVESNCPIG